MRLSAFDEHIIETEIAWLNFIAYKNGLSHLLVEEVERLKQTGCTDNQENNLELQHLKWE
jgi:hypothetical protein